MSEETIYAGNFSGAEVSRMARDYESQLATLRATLAEQRYQLTQLEEDLALARIRIKSLEQQLEEGV